MQRGHVALMASDYQRLNSDTVVMRAYLKRLAKPHSRRGRAVFALTVVLISAVTMPLSYFGLAGLGY